MILKNFILNHLTKLLVSMTQIFDTKKEHLNIYDGLPTNTKLERLSIDKKLPQEAHKGIWESKQKYTLEMLNEISKDAELREILEELKANDIKLHVVQIVSKRP